MEESWFSPIEKKNYPENKRREVRGIYVNKQFSCINKESRWPYSSSKGLRLMLL